MTLTYKCHKIKFIWQLSYYVSVKRIFTIKSATQAFLRQSSPSFQLPFSFWLHWSVNRWWLNVLWAIARLPTSGFMRYILVSCTTSNNIKWTYWTSFILYDHLLSKWLFNRWSLSGFWAIATPVASYEIYHKVTAFICKDNYIVKNDMNHPNR